MRGISIIYYKKNGDNIPVLDQLGNFSPLVPAELYDKIINDFTPQLPLYLFIDGTSFQIQRVGNHGASNLPHDAKRNASDLGG